MSALITLSEYKQINGVKTTDIAKDAEITAALPWASAAVVSWTERDFGAPVVTEERTYNFDGSGFVDIDDAQSISAVSLSIPNTVDQVLTTEQWVAGPPRRDDVPMFYYLQLFTGLGINPVSPEMGFTRNWDVMAREGRWLTSYPTVKVTGTWGWSAIPEDVKIAIAWTISDWQARPSGEGVTAQAIESYSVSYGGRSGGAGTPWLAIPNRARDLLARYTKINV